VADDAISFRRCESGQCHAAFIDMPGTLPALFLKDYKDTPEKAERAELLQ
jgi:hypothetical protein